MKTEALKRSLKFWPKLSGRKYNAGFNLKYYGSALKILPPSFPYLFLKVL